MDAKLATRKETLLKELAKIEETEETERKKSWEKKKHILLDNIDIFLSLFPEHTCNGSDTLLNGRYRGRCVRCVLIEAKRDDFWDDEIDLQITTVYTPIPYQER